MTADPSPGPPPRIYLTGFMASGKTAVGRVLASRLGYRFLDLDAEVEALAGASVRQIFERRGEAAFRDLEHRALAATAEESRAVIATGGGLMTIERNRALLGRLGTSVWLDPSFDTLLARLDEEGRAKRPLFAAPEQARELHRQRLDAYRRADLRVGIDAGETAERVAARIAALFEGTPCDT